MVVTRSIRRQSRQRLYAGIQRIRQRLWLRRYRPSDWSRRHRIADRQPKSIRVRSYIRR